jgi:hypothetical protein
VDGELERTWKEVVLVNLKYYPSSCVEGQGNHEKPQAG